jgi:hypothetical protein
MIERLGLAQSSSIPVRLASASRNFAATVLWIASLRHAEIASLRRRSLAAALRSASNSFPQPPFQVCLKRAARRMARVSKPHPYEAPWPSAGGRERGK